MRPLSGQPDSTAKQEGGSPPSLAVSRRAPVAATGRRIDAHAQGSGRGGATGSGRIAFYSFLLVNAVLFVRPAEIVPQKCSVLTPGEWHGF